MKFIFQKMIKEESIQYLESLEYLQELQYKSLVMYQLTLQLQQRRILTKK
uniref:Uncharacterized protein n=1 Tax=uncultured marine virus TaxID=186617 RepID=A0A0F7L4C4_9VIRU|nr:hypothetical protein ALOHA_HF400048F7ctg1g11 [uncultured marine virus]